MGGYTSQGEKSIFWLDYTGLKWPDVNAFMSLLQRVELWSMVKITLRAQPSDYECFGKFQEEFVSILPGGADSLPGLPRHFAELILRMLRLLPNKPSRAIQIGYSIRFRLFFYNDSTPMLTLTGIVCPQGDTQAVHDAFGSWAFVNLDWDPPTRISVPSLSTKERLMLQSLLPCDESGLLLQLALGYKLGDGGRRDDTQRQLQQYAAFQKYYPYYVSAVP